MFACVIYDRYYVVACPIRCSSLCPSSLYEVVEFVGLFASLLLDSECNINLVQLASKLFGQIARLVVKNFSTFKRSSLSISHKGEQHWTDY